MSLVAVALALSATGRAAELARVGVPAELTVTESGAHSVRITLMPDGGTLPPNQSLVDRELSEPVLRLRSVDEPVERQVGTLKVQVSAEPLTVRVSNAEGRVLQELVFNSETGNVSFNVGNAPVLGLGEGGQQPGRGRGYQGPQFDRRGRLDNMRPGWGSGTLGSRNPIALLVGTDGWGLWVASPWVQVDLRDEETGHFMPTDEVEPTAGVAAEFRPANQSRNNEEQPESSIPIAARQPFDVFVFDATNPQDMMRDLRDLSGVPAMPPKWALGYMQSHRELRDDEMSPQELLLSVPETFREKQIPVDSLVYLGTGFTPTGWNTPQPSFEFNPEVFEDDPADVISKLKDYNVKVVAHMRDLRPEDMPNIRGNIPPLPGEELDSSHMFPYWQQHEPLIEAGIDAFWPDEGDRFSIYERMTRVQMYYQGHLYTTPHVRPWTLNRNGIIGMARWGAWMWSGDTHSRWETLRDQIWIGLNTGLSITPYWGSDTGGFYTTSELNGELYARWFQFSAFCGSFRSHGRIWRTRTPWGWGLDDMGFLEGQRDPPLQSEMNNPAIEPICRMYANLRYRLLPYTYTICREATDTGMPLMRAMWLHYPDDETARSIPNQYLWGRDIMVAPICEEAQRERDVYLPEGQWYDYWTDELHDGEQTVTRRINLSTMPLYVRAGAIVPFDPVRQYMAQEVDELTTIKVYTGADGEFTMYADDGISQDYLDNRNTTWTRMAWDDDLQQFLMEPDPPQGVTNAVSDRTFKVQLIPENAVKEVHYTGERVSVSFRASPAE